ncbi:hypothetical protein HAP94_24075, partial [Acidithiobacillus ferrivorans]|nr:hypothetical protein [Acidithiobacillus ferrivorans]
MLSPLWDMKIPATWPNKHGVLPEGYHAEWSFDKGRFDKAEIDIALDQTGKYRFSTSGGNGSYAPSVNHGPDFDSFMDAHNAARQELMEGITKRYQSGNVERGFVQAAPKLLARIAEKADGDRFHVAHLKDMLQDPPYKNAFGEIMEQLSGDQRIILQWGYDHDRASRWMVTLHHDENEQGLQPAGLQPVGLQSAGLQHAQAIVAELRQRGNWDFEQAPEYAQVVDPGNPDAWAGFIQRIAQAFPEQGRTALFNAPYGLNQEPVWHIPEPLPAQWIPDQPPAPHWPEDIDHDDLPVEAPGSLKNFDRYVGLRFEDKDQFVSLAIARDKQGYVPAISYRAKGVYGPSSPNARSDHFPTFAAAYAQGRKMLKAHLKEHEKLDWITDADRAAKDWLSNKVDAVQPIFFGYDAARMETVWDRQSKLEGVTVLQLTHTKKADAHLDDDRDSYTLQGIVPGESKTRYINDVDTLDRALLLVNSTFALLGDASPVLEREGIAPGAAVFPMDVQMAATISDDHSNAASLLTTDPQKKSEHLQRAESIVSDLKEQFGDLLTPAPFAQTPAPEGKSPLPGARPLLHQAEQIAEDARKQVERLQNREGNRQGSVTLGEIMAEKITDAVSVARLEALFGSDEALGVRFVDHQGNEIPATEDADGQSVFPDDTSAITCTNYALQIRKGLPDHVVQIVGFENEHNPDCAVVREDWHPDGHDFAIVDHRWLVDPWARLVAGTRDQIVYDLQVDARLVAETYGDPLKWETTGENRRDMTDFSRWDRTGLDAVIEAYEAIRLKAAGITITEAAIIPTRAGIIAVPKDKNLPIYHAGQVDPAPKDATDRATGDLLEEQPEPMRIEESGASWLSGIPEDFRETVRSILAPFTALSAKVKDATLTAVRPSDSRMLNVELEAPEWWRNGQILLHAKIEDVTHNVVERGWSLSWSREAINNGQLYAMFTQIRDHGLLESLRSVDRVKADYGHVVVSGIMGRNEIAEIMTCQGLQPLRLLLTVEPDGLSAETLNRLTDHLVDRLRGWRTDFQNTPVVIDVLTMQGFPDTVMNQLRIVAESVQRASTIDPEVAVRRADLTAQIGAPCDWVAPIMGRNFRSQQKKDLVKPMLVVQSDLIEVRLENLLPEVLNTLYQRNEANHRQMDLQGITSLSRTLDSVTELDAIVLQTPEVQAQPQTVEESTQPADQPPIQANLLNDAPELVESTGSPVTLTPSAGVRPTGTNVNPDPVADADWQQLKGLRMTVPKILDASVDQRPLLDRLVKQGIPLSLSQEPSSVNYVAAILESGELSGVGVQAWSVNRNDLVAQDAELRELRFYNGDSEQRHVFLLVSNRFLFDPWMAINKPGTSYVLDVQIPFERDTIIDRYLSPVFWTSPHPITVLSPAWRELERWNPDLQAFTEPDGLGMEQSDILPETSVEMPETMVALPETKWVSSETMAPETKKTPDHPELSTDPVPSVDLPGATLPSSARPVRSTAAPREQEDIMDWKSLSETPEIRPELAATLQGLAEHPERLPEAGRFWAQSVPQEVLREMLVSLSAEWDRDYWKMTVDFLVNSLSGDPSTTSVDLGTHGRRQDAITGLSFLLMHLAASESYWPDLNATVLDKNAFLQRLESLPNANPLQGATPLPESTPAQSLPGASLPAASRGEMGPDDRIVRIALLPLDAEQLSWKPESGTAPVLWKLVATLQDGWEIPKVLKDGVTYAQALQAAQTRAQKWNAELVDAWASQLTLNNLAGGNPADGISVNNGWPTSPVPMAVISYNPPPAVSSTAVSNTADVWTEISLAPQSPEGPIAAV